MTGSRVMASNVSGPTNRRADARHHRLDAVAALLQQARDLDGLVGADAAGDAEADEGHGVPTSVVGVGVARDGAARHFLQRAPRGLRRALDLRHAALAATAARAAAATVTNSNEFFGRDVGRRIVQSCALTPLSSRNVVTIGATVGRRRARRARSAVTIAHNLAHAPVELVVDDDVVVLVDRVDLGAGRRRAAARSPPRSILAAPAQPPLEHLERRRQHEDADRVRHPLPHLPGALDVDHQHEVEPGRQPRLGLAAGRCRTGCRRRRPTRGTRPRATMASNSGRLDKIIVDAVDLARTARRATCRTATAPAAGTPRPAARRPSSCRCPTAPRPRTAGRAGRPRYSTFCTCSRMRSSSALAAMTISVARRALDLRPDGVDLAVHFLHEEIELAAARLRAVGQRPPVLDVAAQPHDFLVDVGPRHEPDDFLRDRRRIARRGRAAARASRSRSRASSCACPSRASRSSSSTKRADASPSRASRSAARNRPSVSRITTSASSASPTARSTSAAQRRRDRRRAGSRLRADVEHLRNAQHVGRRQRCRSTSPRARAASIACDDAARAAPRRARPRAPAAP